MDTADWKHRATSGFSLLGRDIGLPVGGLLTVDIDLPMGRYH